MSKLLNMRKLTKEDIILFTAFPILLFSQEWESKIKLSQQQQTKMKGQILSRIQSYQNIPMHMPMNPHRTSTNQSSKLINQAKFLKYTTNMTKQSPSDSVKVLSPSPKAKSHRFLFSQHGPSSTTKKMNSTINKDVKRSLNFDLPAVRKNSQTRNSKLVSRGSQKHLLSKNLSKNAFTEPQNQPNSQNIQNDLKESTSNLKYPKFIQNAIKLNKQIKQPNTMSVARRKQLMRIYSKIDLNKQKIGIGSQQNIRTLQIGEQTSKDPQLLHMRHNMMMKTVNVFNKPSPYLAFNNKKFTIKSPHKAPTKSLNRIPTICLLQKQEDVSIQISMDEKQKEKQKQREQSEEKIENQDMQFGCSSIKQKQIDNDSSFLEAVQKNIFNEMDSHDMKEESKKKKWKKLPSDFLKL